MIARSFAHCVEGFTKTRTRFGQVLNGVAKKADFRLPAPARKANLSALYGATAKIDALIAKLREPIEGLKKY